MKQIHTLPCKGLPARTRNAIVAGLAMGRRNEAAPGRYSLRLPIRLPPTSTWFEKVVPELERLWDRLNPGRRRPCGEPGGLPSSERSGAGLYHPIGRSRPLPASIGRHSMNAVAGAQDPVQVALSAARAAGCAKELALKKIDPIYNRLERFLAGPPSQDVVRGFRLRFKRCGWRPGGAPSLSRIAPSSGSRLKASAMTLIGL